MEEPENILWDEKWDMDKSGEWKTDLGKYSQMDINKMQNRKVRTRDVYAYI